jgi:hypothetical protein
MGLCLSSNCVPPSQQEILRVMAYNVTMDQDILAFNSNLPEDRRKICERLAKEIQEGLPGGELKIWHGSPVWFLDDNPIVGYDSLKDAVRLLFWSGQSFGETGLQPEGSFKAAEVRYRDVGQIVSDDLRRWLDKSQNIQWDYKNIVKRKGRLERIK